MAAATKRTSSLTHKQRTLGLIGLLLLLVFAFVYIVFRVQSGDTDEFDRAAIMSLRIEGDPAMALGPDWLEKWLRDITSLGSAAVLTLVTVIASGFLIVIGRLGPAVLVAVAVSSGAIAEQSLKAAFDRARPGLVPHMVTEASLSFPSAHAMLSALTYLTICALLAQAQTRWRARTFVMAMGILLTVMISFSRVYLGVHWPTDVLAGWTFGAIWALAFWMIADGIGWTRRIRSD